MSLIYYCSKWEDLCLTRLSEDVKNNNLEIEKLKKTKSHDYTAPRRVTFTYVTYGSTRLMMMAE